MRKNHLNKQQNSSESPEAQARSGEDQSESERKERITNLADSLNVKLTKEFALYIIYGDSPEEDWEEPIPKWVKKLPDGDLFQPR